MVPGFFFLSVPNPQILAIPVFLTAFMRYYVTFPLQLKGQVLTFLERSDSWINLRERNICVVFYDAVSSVVAYNDGIVDER